MSGEPTRLPHTTINVLVWEGSDPVRGALIRAVDDPAVFGRWAEPGILDLFMEVAR